MGCCCFNTLRGAAFFVSSIQIYNGLECMLKFIAFPMVFSSMHASKEPGEATSIISFMPGMVYAILYFLLGCAIFRGIEQECARNIKWGAVCFAITEISFFILRQVFKVTPTPKVKDLPQDEQPFEMNIYKTLYYFLFTIVGGLIYVCILFLYLQQLSKGQDEFSQFFNISARAPWAAPTPTTTTQAPQPPANPQQQQQQQQQQLSHQPNPQANSTPGPQSNMDPSQAHQGQGRESREGRGSSKHKHHHQKTGDQMQQNQISNGHNVPQNASRKRHPANVINLNPLDVNLNAGPPIISPPPPMDPQMMKDPCGPGSPSSPMFPYFLMRRSSKHGQQPPPQRCLLDEPPPNTWHPHPRGPPPIPPMRQDHFVSLGDPGGTPRSGASEPIGVGRNLLSPSRLIPVVPVPVVPGPPQFQPLIPPFYPESGDERRDSFQAPGFGSPHYQSQSGYSSRAGGGPESHYQKIPMSPGSFDYCLR